MAKKKQKWGIGDIVAIRRLDGVYIPAQIVDVTPRALNSLVVALFDDPHNDLDGEPIKLDPEDIFSVVFSTRESLDGGDWKVLGSAPVAIPDTLIPSTQLRQSGFVGATIYGTAIIDDFINAFYALAPWDMCYIPDYFDKMLIDARRKPKHLMYKSSMGES